MTDQEHSSLGAAVSGPLDQDPSSPSLSGTEGRGEQDMRLVPLSMTVSGAEAAQVALARAEAVLRAEGASEACEWVRWLNGRIEFALRIDLGMVGHAAVVAPDVEALRPVSEGQADRTPNISKGSSSLGVEAPAGEGVTVEALREQLAWCVGALERSAHDRILKSAATPEGAAPERAASEPVDQDVQRDLFANLSGGRYEALQRIVGEWIGEGFTTPPYSDEQYDIFEALELASNQGTYDTLRPKGGSDA